MLYYAIFGDRCLLCCCKGILATGYAKGQLMTVTTNVTVSEENWRTAARISLREVSHKMAMYKTWYHQIPDNIFDDETDVPWTCKSCANE